ncbi:unnamed protein product, partial [Ixodes persulcatus]
YSRTNGLARRLETPSEPRNSWNARHGGEEGWEDGGVGNTRHDEQGGTANTVGSGPGSLPGSQKGRTATDVFGPPRIVGYRGSIKHWRCWQAQNFPAKSEVYLARPPPSSVLTLPFPLPTMPDSSETKRHAEKKSEKPSTEGK